MCDIQSFLTMTQEHLNLDAFILRKPSAKQQQSMIKFMVDLLILSTFISLTYECLPNLFNGQNPIPIASPSSPVCAGCPTATGVNQDIVNFAMTQLNWGECEKTNVNVENFQSQVCKVGTLMGKDVFNDDL